MNRKTVLLTAALAALAVSAGHSDPVSAGAEIALTRAERLLTAASGLPSLRVPDPEAGLREAEEAFLEVVTTHGASGRAYQGLGRVRLGLGRWRPAEQAFTQGLEIDPGDPALIAGLKEAKRLQALVARAAVMLRPGERVVHLRPAGVNARPDDWLLLAAEDRSSRRALFPHGRPRLLLVSFAGGRSTLRAASRPLCDPRFQPDCEYTHVSLSGADFTGDGFPEAVVSLVLAGASWSPSQLAVFQVSGTSLREALLVQGHDPPWCADLDGNGRPEVIVENAIGWYPAHVAQPRWQDVYAWSTAAGRLLEANRRFPTFFRAWPGKIKAVLASHPNDGELWTYYATALDICGRRAEAQTAYRRALRVFPTNIEDAAEDAVREVRRKAQAGLRGQGG